MSETPAQRLLRNDPRTGRVAALDAAKLPAPVAEALLRMLADGETVLALYHHGLGYAALTVSGLIVLPNVRGGSRVREYRPLKIVRGARGGFGAVTVLVDGRPRKLWGSKLDPKGELLEAAGELLPSGPSSPPDSGTPPRGWVRRHPVLALLAAAVLLRAGVSAVADAGSGGEEAAAQARPERTVVVPAFAGSSLRDAAARAGTQPWLHVSAADASSASRPVTSAEAGWRVCFQIPAQAETVLPSARTLTLYAVPDREKCPDQLFGSARIVMPDLVGKRLDDASGLLGALGLARTVSFHAHTGTQLDGATPVTWQVCRQQPASGAEIPTGTQVSLWLIASGEPCTAPSPSSPSPEPKAKPRPKPRPKPDPRPSYGTTSGGSSGGGSSGGSSGGSGGGGSRVGARFGAFCSPVGARATTVDGRPAKCYLGKDGRARWSYYGG